jgi:hypothetical protein
VKTSGGRHPKYVTEHIVLGRGGNWIWEQICHQRCPTLEVFQKATQFLFTRIQNYVC